MDHQFDRETLVVERENHGMLSASAVRTPGRASTGITDLPAKLTAIARLFLKFRDLATDKHDSRPPRARGQLFYVVLERHGRIPFMIGRDFSKSCNF